MSDLSDLFDTDPYTLTKDSAEVRKMVDHLRAQRHQFAANESRGERAAPAKRPAKPKPIAVTLDELDL